MGEAEEFLAGASGLVEANTFERHSLWEANQHHKKPMSWKEETRGYLETIGWLDHRPVVVSLFKATIEGQVIVFWHATSQVIDHAQIENWFGKIMPKSARHSNGQINKTDAMNFCNVFR